MKKSLMAFALPSMRWVLVAVMALCWPMAASANSDDPDSIIDAFLEQVAASGELTNEQKATVVDVVTELRRDDSGKSRCITAGLLAMYPDYESAILLADEDVERAESQLRPMLESDNKFLVADAAFYLARTLLGAERNEDALDLLQQVTGDLAAYTLHTGNARYFLGVAQANLLHNREAIDSFSRFLEENPQAPERLRVAAFRQREMLASIEQGSLSDVFQRMDFSRRRLKNKQTGEVTQARQDEIVNMLAKLIKEQEKQECSSCSSSTNQQQQGQQPQDGQASNPGQGKSNKGGTSNQQDGIATRTYDNGPPSPWSRLRERSRDPANQAVKERLAARYKRVVEKYYDAVNDVDAKK